MLNEVQKIIGEVYLVGGSVRDELIGIPCKDYDFTTPLSPDEIEQKIREANRKPYLIGKKFGTIGFKVEYDGKYEYVEVTTFRKEQYQQGNRKPEVEFVTNLKEDLSRRDFTINAICKGQNGIYDPFGGRLDILERQIKCVGLPKDRFKEDPLRIMRAARFASQLGFEIEQLTLSTMKRMAHTILNISKERWVEELDKILLTKYPSAGLKHLMYCNIFNYIIPELTLNKDWNILLEEIDRLDNNLELRWAFLLKDIAKPFIVKINKDKISYPNHEILAKEMVIKLGTYLKWSNNRIKQVSDLVLYQERQNSPLKNI